MHWEQQWDLLIYNQYVLLKCVACQPALSVSTTRQAARMCGGLVTHWYELDWSTAKHSSAVTVRGRYTCQVVACESSIGAMAPDGHPVSVCPGRAPTPPVWDPMWISSSASW
jgi:hypothetical protein